MLCVSHGAWSDDPATNPWSCARHADVYSSHDRPIGRRTRGYILTTDRSDGGHEVLTSRKESTRPPSVNCSSSRPRSAGVNPGWPAEDTRARHGHYRMDR
eukprot:8078315-Pyramimonas_sp.AAC.1